jgi:glycosyltransferase involved in cell wall biosynthesis
VKLVIQIPCLNEADYLPQTVADLPRQIPGIDSIEVVVVDDGSTDDTCGAAARAGVHHIVRFPENRGLAAAFMAGLDAALKLGADIVVNTDADNQYRGADIARLVAPIIEGEADMVIGDRHTDDLKHFSLPKRMLQRWGSGIVRGLSGTTVRDATSGFRAMTAQVAARLFVHNSYSYTLETVVQAGKSNITIRNVDIDTNAPSRDSRLFSSIPQYLRRIGPTIFRAYIMARPLRTFLLIAGVMFAFGLLGVGRFLYFFALNPLHSGHVQSLVLGVGLSICAVVVALLAVLGDLLAANRRLLEDLRARMRQLENGKVASGKTPAAGIESTGQTAWRSEPPPPREPEKGPEPRRPGNP